jgi:hypothetical protein
MFPSRSSLPALTAFARPGPGANRSPTSSLLFGHRTPSASSAPALAGRPPVFPWASLPRVDASSACRTALAVTPADRASVPVGASEAGRRSPVARMFPEEGRGPPRLLGCPPCIRAAVQHPAGPPRARLTAPRRCCVQEGGAPPHQDTRHFGTATLRPASSPTYASTAPLLERQQGWLPARWLGFGRAGFEPAGHLLRISYCHLISIPS